MPPKKHYCSWNAIGNFSLLWPRELDLYCFYCFRFFHCLVGFNLFTCDPAADCRNSGSYLVLWVSFCIWIIRYVYVELYCGLSGPGLHSMTWVYLCAGIPIWEQELNYYSSSKSLLTRTLRIYFRYMFPGCLYSRPCHKASNLD